MRAVSFPKMTLAAEGVLALLSYLTTLLHRFPDSSDFDQRAQEYELEYLKSSRHAQRWQSNKPDGHLRADAAGQIPAIPVSLKARNRRSHRSARAYHRASPGEEPSAPVWCERDRRPAAASETSPESPAADLPKTDPISE
jgi:hypothetical protein